MCDWEFVNEFKHFWIFEKLMNSEILKKIEIKEFIFRGEFPEIEFISGFHFKKAQRFFVRALGARIHTLIGRSSTQHTSYTLCTSYKTICASPLIMTFLLTRVRGS